MTEQDLARLGVFRIAIPVPFKAAGGPVNAYLVEESGGGVMLFDSGLGSTEAEEALEQGFRDLGRRFDLVLPGHGPPFSGHRQLVDRLLDFYAKRQARILELLSAAPATAYELSCELFPSARDADAFLTVSETIANVEVLEEAGKVERREEGGVYRFRPRAGH